MIFEVKLHPKKRPRFWKGRVFTDKRDVILNKYLRLMFINAKRKYSFDTYKQAIKVEIFIFLTRPKTSKLKYVTVKPDLDNYIKTVLDVGNGIFWNDDNIITHITASKEYAEKNYFILNINGVKE